jgi:ribose transport system ATP-binding protein
MTDTRSDVPVLEARGLTKRFGAVLAVDEVSFELGRGEILALLGDNGAGKSTLIKCISGAHRADEGEILIDGQPVALHTPTDARAHGIETVYQDLALFDDLNVVANLFAGREIAAPRRPVAVGWMRSRQMRRVAEDTLDRLAVNLPSMSASVKLLSGGQRQAIAVARAVHFATSVVILDEPTAALGVRETRNVQRLVKQLPEQGISVILISHNLDQVADVADRAMIMRRGRKVGEAIPDHANHDQIVSMIVGAQVLAQ